MRAFPVTLLGLLLAVAVLAPAGAPGAEPAGKPTRADREAQRRRAAQLESEYALASTRKPYLLLDLGTGNLQYRLMGMTLREVSLGSPRVEGLRPSTGASTDAAPALAGIFTLVRKDGDPRLTPLTPEQVEAGADDENVANVLAPEIPSEYHLSFKQPMEIQVAGGEGGGLRQRFAWIGSLWERLGIGRKRDEPRLRIVLRLDAVTTAEFYRSIIPDLKFLVVPPPGMVLPPAGQEAPPKPKAARSQAPAKPPKPIEPPGVPFQIPAPVEENGVPVKPPEGEPGSESQPPVPEPPPDPPPPEPPAEEPDDEPPPPSDPGRPGARLATPRTGIHLYSGSPNTHGRPD